MMKNKFIAEIFYSIADILEMQGVKFKPQAYRKAARNIETMQRDIDKVYKEKGLAGLKEIPGVGEAIAKKSEELIKTGKLEYYEELKKSISKELELIEIPGMGPKRAGILKKKLGISSLKKLEAAARRGKLRNIEGFGEKTEQKILKNIEIYKKGHERILLGHALPIAEEIKRMVASHEEVKKSVIAGSLARRKETIGDLDILAVSENPDIVMDYFTEMENVKNVIAKGKTKSSVILNSGIQVDLRIIEDDSFGSAIQYFVGSKEHNVKMRKLAIKKGMKLSEYGVFKGKNKVAGKDEKKVYEVLGVKWIPYELREDRGEVEAAMNNKLPKLIEYEKVLGDFQMHTNFSDGNNTVHEMALCCKKLGYKYVAITDHYGSMKIANSMDKKRLIIQFKEIERAEKEIGIKIFKGAEVNIRPDGILDAEASVLKQLDVVVASIHSSFNQPKNKATKRLVKAIENKYVNIIGHPSGRIIGKRQGLEFDWAEIFDAAKSNRVALEINGQPDRMDMRDIQAKSAVENRVAISLGTDAHSTQQLANMELAVSQARRAWCEKKDVLNYWPLKKVERFLS